MRIGVALALLLLLSASAEAQEFETPTPAPPRRSSIPDPGVTPSFGVLQAHVFSREIDESLGYTAAIPVFVGATFHPMPARVSPFSNVGVEMQYLPYSGRVEWIPTGRFGIAILLDDEEGKSDDFFRQLFPAFDVYVLAGWRIPSEVRGGAGRIGFGIASPVLMPLTMAESCFPAPSLLEATMDVSDTKGGPRDYQLRLGWFF